MRILHTSDWHLGRAFHRVSLLGAQARFVDHLVEVVRSERVGAVLVSGDVYDRAMPSPETVALLSEALTRLVDAGARVVLSSGNHDSATRLGFAADLLERAGVAIRTSVAQVGQPVLLGDVAVYPLPYLEPAPTARAMGLAEPTHAAVLAAAMDRVRADAAGRRRSVVMAHAFVTGCATSDSERDISVGGLGAVHPRVFRGVDYVALGHLHGRQRVSEHARYSGSPLPLSFSEADHAKGSWLVDLSGSAMSVAAVDAPVPRRLARLRGSLAELLADPTLAWAEQAWCQVTLTDATHPLGAMEAVQRRFPHTLELRFDGPVSLRSSSSYAARVRHRDDLQLCCDFLSHVRAVAPTPAEEAVVAAAVEASRLDRAALADEGQAVADPREGVA